MQLGHTARESIGRELHVDSFLFDSHGDMLAYVAGVDSTSWLKSLSCCGQGASLLVAFQGSRDGQVYF